MKRISLLCFLLYSITALSQNTKNTKATLLSHDGYWYLYSVQNETEDGDNSSCDTTYYSRADFPVIMFEANGTYTQTQADNNRAVAARWTMVDNNTYRISNTKIGPKTNIDVNIISIDESEMIATVNLVDKDGVNIKKTYKYCYPSSKLLSAEEVLDRNTVVVYKSPSNTIKPKINSGSIHEQDNMMANQLIDRTQPNDSYLNHTDSRSLSKRIRRGRNLDTGEKYLDTSKEITAITTTEFPDFSNSVEVDSPSFENIATIVDQYRLSSPSSWSNAFVQEMLLNKYICNQSLIDNTVLFYSGLLSQKTKGAKKLNIINSQDNRFDSFTFDTNGDITSVNGMKMIYDKGVPIKLTNNDNDISFYYDINKMMIENLDKEIDYLEFDNNFEPIVYRSWNKIKNSFSNKYFTTLIETLSDYSFENGSTVTKQLLFTNKRQIPFEIIDAYRETDAKKRYYITQPSANIFEIVESNVDGTNGTLIHKLHYNSNKKLTKIETIRKTEENNQILRITIFDYELY